MSGRMRMSKREREEREREERERGERREKEDGRGGEKYHVEAM
jgi:hypothetical protein